MGAVTTEPTDKEEAGPPETWRRWLTWGLVASVSVNMLVAGVWAGHAMREAPTVAEEPRRDTITRVLPQEQRAAWEAALQASEPRLREIRVEMMYVHQDILRVIRGVPFEAQALAEAFEERRSLNSGLKAERHRKLIEITATMSREQRALFADRMEQVVETWARRRKIVPVDRPASDTPADPTADAMVKSPAEAPIAATATEQPTVVPLSAPVNE